MQSLILAATTFLGLVAAAPANMARDTISKDFYLSMQIKSGSINTTYNGWQVETYHTGAGLNDPVFVPSGSIAYLNGTQLLFKSNSEFPNGMTASIGDTNYARWEPVTVNAGYGGATFELNEAGLIVNTQGGDGESGGWIVCEWYHGGPQLFQLINGFDGDLDTIPATCGVVDLLPVYV